MKHIKNQRGMAMFIIIMILFFLVPIVYVLSKWTSGVLRGETYEKTLKNARLISTVVISDYMRQFSQDPNEDHYATYQLNKPTYNFSGFGFSDPVIISSSSLRTLYITTQGTYQRSLTVRKTLQTLIHFENDMTRFALILTGNPGDTLDMNTGTLDSNFHVDGGSGGAIWTYCGLQANGTPPGAGVVTINGSVVAANLLHVTPLWSGAFTGPLYSTGSIGPVTVNNFVPPINILPISLLYYGAKNNYATTAANETWSFAPSGMFSVGVGPAVPQFNITIPGQVIGTGSILYAKGCNITIPASTINGRVTVVSVIGDGPGFLGGTVKITGNIDYLNGGTKDAFAVIAEGGITFDNTAAAGGIGGDMHVRGMYYIPQGPPPLLTTNSDPGTSFTLTGTLMAPISSFNGMFSGSTFPNGRNFIYDPNLTTCFPPGLPEKPHLIMWRLQG